MSTLLLNSRNPTLEYKVVCNAQSEQLELIRRWRDALEGSNKAIAFDLLDQVIEGKITNAAAFAALDSKHDQVC